MDQLGLHIECPRDFFQPVEMAVCHISDFLFLLFVMLGTSYTHHGLLCKGLSSQNVDGKYALCDYIPYDRESCDTNLHFYFVVPQVRIFFYYGILNDGFDCPHERCRGYSLYVRLAFVVV